ncbi:hypothetical protein HDU79_000401 [Rhizoclosmatium sp. JEL0117]|nr:hypothetical protein HDU79_000401 [Rhizoclosmatium sp. JEL0117]
MHILTTFLIALATTVASAPRAHAMPGRTSLPIFVNLTQVAPTSLSPHSDPPSNAAVRAVLNTGPPPASSATGTAIWAGQSAAIRFTAPPDVPPYGARLIEIQLVLRASAYARSNLRLSVVEDAGFNAPGTVLLETRDISIPAYDGRVTITANSNAYLYPGELFWIILDGNAGYVQNAPSWLDSVNGVAWTAFNTWTATAKAEKNAAYNKEQVFDKDIDAENQQVMDSTNVGRWIVERSRSASSTRVLVQ